MSTRQMHAVPMSFEDWFQREWPHITIDSYDAERIRIGWNAALRYAAGICRDVDIPGCFEDAHYGADICAQAIEARIKE